MGMFDTLHIQDKGRKLAIQSKHFACMLNDYRIGDFVSFDHHPPTGVTVYTEQHKQDWRDPACHLEWVVILLVDGWFLDAYVTDSETDAEKAATILVKLWQSPERQAEALKRHASDHYDARMRYRRALERLASLLHDYADWETDKAVGENNAERRTRLFQHDFDKETWDHAVARMLLGMVEFRERVPVRYVPGNI